MFITTEPQNLQYYSGPGSAVNVRYEKVWECHKRLTVA